MKPDAEIKKEFKQMASKEPEKYYPVNALQTEGFMRKQCKCGTFFWTVNPEQATCGDPNCIGGFKFIGNSPAKEKMSYLEVWQKFSKMFKERGYQQINRYPVVARWNQTSDFTLASISAFQPYVVDGTAEAPAKKLVIPQFCLRFNDVDNVGITGSHMTGFVMIGQHAFLKPEEWDQEKLFLDIYAWLRQGLGLPKNEITFHEDAWAGGGNFGPCIEYFSRGCEIGNQVYMMYEQTPYGNKELKLKVLDMGMGQERNAWFSQGAVNIYEAVFPEVNKKIFKITGIQPDYLLLKRFYPHASYLNAGEVDNIEKSWNEIAAKLNTSVTKLKGTVLPVSAIYSIAEHARSVMFAIADGGLPSNAGGGYNLRAILRRTFSFIDKYGWNIDLAEICEMHASNLQKQYPELKEALPEIIKIIEVEKRKYKESRQKAHKIISELLKTEITPKKLVEVYDSHGISPELIEQDARLSGQKIKIPDNFYALVAEKHEAERRKYTAEETSAELSEELKDTAPTKALYFDDYTKTNFKAKIAKVIGNKIILDQTYFYPTSGGQSNDTGFIAGEKVIDVIKEGKFILHVLAGKHNFPVGEEVECSIDFERRKQLTQHHTGAHIVNGAARQAVGNHIWQAGASKTVDHGRLDITHFEQLTPEEVQKIEDSANEIIKKNIKINKFFMDRTRAEKTYGFRLYQGGAVPGKELRIVEIPDFDVEACAGTHLNKTGEAEAIKILKTSKISDAVVRIEYAAGKAIQKTQSNAKAILEEASEVLKCEFDQIPGRAKELFEKWKDFVKKGKEIDFQFRSKESFKGSEEEILKLTASYLKTQPEHINNTLRRFLREIEERKK